MFLSRINFKQPKYMIPAIIYLPVLFTGYFILDIFNTEIPESDNGLETTEYLNSNLPTANFKDDGIGGRTDNMKKSFGDITDYSAVDNIDRDDRQALDEFNSRYSDEERRLLETDAARRSEELDRLREMQEAINANAEKGAGMTGGNGSSLPTEEERLARAQDRQDAAMEELNRALAEARLTGRRAVQQARDTIVSDAVAMASHEKEREIEDNGAVRSIDENAKASEVVKAGIGKSDYFNTIADNEPSPSLIKAIIDEDISAVDGSRVRLRLLDEILIDDVILKKGSYIYATMSGFGKQRVKGSVTSIMACDELFKVNLSLYDTDGLEGLYVPQSKFRETAKNVGAGAMSGSMNLNSGAGSDQVKTWGLNALNNAYQKTANAISKAISQNKVHLKYGTQVFLVNGREKRDR